MFGYIRPYKPEMKIKEYDAFQAVYCGLCHQLGESFGFLARMTLNYDFVFLALLYYTQSESPPTVYQGRCRVNPLQKVNLCRLDSGTAYSADIAAIMIYYKIKDNIEDSGAVKKIGWSIVKAVAVGSWKRAVERQPLAEEIIKTMMEKQKEIEGEKSPSLDAASEPTAWAFSKIVGSFSEKEEENLRQMKRLGYLIGRFVYLCDAVDDVEKDIKSHNYNPMIYRYIKSDTSSENIKAAKEQARGAILMTVGEIAQIVEEIDFTCFKPVIKNIVDFGLMHSLEGILSVEVKTGNEKSL